MGPGDLAAVDVDAGRHVHGDPRHVTHLLHDGPGVVAQRPAPADADDAVERHVVGAAGPVDHDATGAAQRGQSLRVGGVGAQQHGVDRGSAAGEEGAREQRVPAVVAGTDDEQHARAVAAADEVGDRVRQAGRRPLHQRPVRGDGEQLLLGGPDLLDRVRRPHAGSPSSTTKAVATPASWVSDRWTRRTPRALAARATVPRISK